MAFDFCLQPSELWRIYLKERFQRSMKMILQATGWPLQMQTLMKLNVKQKEKRLIKSLKINVLEEANSLCSDSEMEVGKARKLSTLRAMQMVIPSLFIGSMNTAVNKSLLMENGITHVCCCFDMKPPFPDQFTYKVLNANDSPDQNMLQFFEETNTFIANAINEGGKVLVHCAAGISRAATVTLAYMIYSSPLTLEQAYTHLKHVREVICPNKGFVEQLQTFEFIHRYGKPPKQEIESTTTTSASSTSRTPSSALDSIVSDASQENSGKCSLM
eukprot:m.73515 g.73515  ORF g.73515 m.73515 type:complete len:273 (-) comp11773_c0_seq1:1962-2780(-)